MPPQTAPRTAEAGGFGDVGHWAKGLQREFASRGLQVFLGVVAVLDQGHMPRPFEEAHTNAVRADSELTLFGSDPLDDRLNASLGSGGRGVPARPTAAVVIASTEP
nr:hypothetical protein [Saccharopolyspora terrae]